MDGTRIANTQRESELIALLTRQVGLVSDLKSLALQQRALISGGCYDELTKLIHQRQWLVDALISSQRELARLRGGSDVLLNTMSELTRRKAAQLIQQVESGIAAVLNADANDQAALQQGCGRVQSELAELTSGHHARRAYGVRPNESSRFANRTG